MQSRRRWAAHCDYWRTCGERKLVVAQSGAEPEASVCTALGIVSKRSPGRQQSSARQVEMSSRASVLCAVLLSELETQRARIGRNCWSSHWLLGASVQVVELWRAVHLHSRIACKHAWQQLVLMDGSRLRSRGASDAQRLGYGQCSSHFISLQ